MQHEYLLLVETKNKNMLTQEEKKGTEYGRPIGEFSASSFSP